MDSTLITFASEVEFSSLYPNIKFESVDRKIVSIGKNTFVSVLGVGLVNYGANLARILVENHFGSVIILGICGAYSESGLSIGEMVRVDTETVGDLGVQECDGSFVPWRAINNTQSDFYSASPLDRAPEVVQKLKGVSGLSVNCCTGTESMASMRYRLFGADVESMEGAAGFAVCNALKISVYQVRVVSNVASTRDLTRWEVASALKILKTQFLDRWDPS
ncbi:MAG: futalosine hydrolase [Fibrobacteraceae bacterium]